MATPTLALIPTGYKAGKLYSVLPESGVGDFTVVRATEATRVNEEGLIETMGANVPRLDYSGGGCPVLLTEPQRTNLITYSEDFNQSSFYDLSNDVTIETSSIISPKGIIGVQELRENSDNDDHLIKSVNTFTETDSSFSIFAKYKGNNRNIKLSLGTGKYASFDLQNGTYFDVQASTVAEIEEYPNGWYRCIINGDITSSKLNIILLNGTTETYLGDGTSGVYIWGAQFESGSYPTSYIKTEGSAVTRNADQVYGAGDAATFNDSEGVLMAEIAALTEVGDGTTRLSISDGSQDNNITIGYSATNTLRTIIRSGASNQALMTSSQTITNYLKVVVKYKANDFALWVNGFEVATDTSGSAPVGLSELSFDRGDAALPFYGNTKQIQYFNTALTDSELETLTSWTSFIEMAQALNYNII